jgi:hypothetical protein
LEAAWTDALAACGASIAIAEIAAHAAGIANDGVAEAIFEIGQAALAAGSAGFSCGDQTAARDPSDISGAACAEGVSRPASALDGELASKADTTVTNVTLGTIGIGTTELRTHRFEDGAIAGGAVINATMACCTTIGGGSSASGAGLALGWLCGVVTGLGQEIATVGCARALAILGTLNAGVIETSGLGGVGTIRIGRALNARSIRADGLGGIGTIGVGGALNALTI